MTYESAHGILARYHAKVNSPSCLIRKRGNPQSVLKAVTFLRGTSACVLCGHVGKTELHHTDGNWRNYTLDNLQYYCKTCHLTHHKLLEMHMPKIVYTDAIHKQIVAAVDKGVAAGHTKKEMYAQLAPKFNVGVSTIENRYYYSPAEIREKANRSNARKTGKPVQKRARVMGAPAVQGGVQVVSLEKAEGMIQMARQFGFATQVSITFLS